MALVHMIISLGIILQLVESRLLSSSSSSDYIQVHFFYSFQSISTIEFLVEGSNLSFLFIPELNSTVSLINDHKIGTEKIERRVINDNLEFVYHNELLKGIIVESELKLRQGQSKPIHLNYYVTSNYTYGIRSSIGLGFTFDNENYSFIHQLKRRGYINSLSFAFAFETLDKESLFFGSLPNEYTHNKSHGYIDIIGSGPQWDFYLSSVIMSNNTQQIEYDEKVYSYFISTDKYIYAPPSFYDLLIDDFLKVAIQSKLCYVQTKSPTRYLLCVKEPSLDIGEISFVIGKSTYVFTIAKFWSCGEDLCILSLREHQKEDQWIFGYHFYNYFNTVFNYETKQIHFYVSMTNALTKIRTIKDDENCYSSRTIIALKAAIISNIVWLIIGVLFLIGIKLQVK